MQIIGILTDFTPLEYGTTSGGKMWKKQNIIVQNDSYHQQPICFSIFGDHIESIIAERGKKVRVDFEIIGSLVNDKWYNNLKVFNVFVINEKDEIIRKHILGKRPDAIL